MRTIFKTLFASLLLAGLSLTMAAQTRTVTGAVSEAVDNGLSPIPGVGIVVKENPKMGAVTNLDGHYSIQVPTTGTVTLVYSCIGYDDLELVVGNNTVVNATLSFSSELLDDVVVVGYGVQKRSDVAGSVTTIKSEDLASFPSNSVAEMMRGKAAGVQVTTSSGAPGSNASIQIRGVRSLKENSNTPMFVIDGVVATETEFNSVDPDDVESLEILKDAASQAIYGARAANGVVMITTKRGKEEKATITFNSTISMQRLWRNFEFYNPEEYYQLRREAIAHDYGYGVDPGSYDMELATLTPHLVLTDDVMERMYENGQATDWEKLMFSPALMQKYSLSVRGGGKKVKISASAGYLNQKGMVNIGSRFQRGNLRFNADYEARSWLTIGVSTSYIKSSNLGAPADFNSYIVKSPLSTPYEEDGKTYAQYSNSTGEKNPLYDAQYYKKNVDTDITRLNGYIDIHPFKGFSYRFNGGYYNRFQETGEYKKKEYTGGGAAGSIKNSKLHHYTLENILSYQVPFNNKDYSLNLTAVQSYEYQVTKDLGFGANNVPVDSFWWNMIADGENSSQTRSVSEYKLLSFLFRAQFGYKDRYLVNVAMRCDGSSRFGRNNKWGYFPSVSAAWRISQEPWMKEARAVSNLKIRVSYGLVGNQNGIGNYETLGTVADNDYEFGNNYIMGYLPGSTLANPNLKWESTGSANIGVDFGFFKNRLNGTIEYYNTTTYDLLFDRNINSVLGYTKMVDNVARTRTQGIDINLDGAIIRNKNLDWTIGTTLSWFNNKIVRLSGEVDENGVPVDDVANKWFIGKPINVLYMYKTDGIFQYSDFVGGQPDVMGKWQLVPTIDTDGDGIPDSSPQRTDTVEPGKVKVVDVNGDGVINASDRIVINKDPKFIASINTSLKFYGVELFMEWYAALGGYNTNPYLSDSNYGGSLQGKNNGIKVDYWTPNNPTNAFPRPSFQSGTTYHSDLTLQSTSYVRLRTLSLGYALPTKTLRKAHLKGVKFTLTATNLLTFSKFLSYSPETRPGAYPEAQQFAASVNFTF